MNVYLDNSSTTKPYTEVTDYMSRIQSDHWGNPSSAHSLGFDAEKMIKAASGIISATLNINKSNLLFTSCGTESNNTALMQPFLSTGRIKGNHFIISEVEHPAVSEPCRKLKSFGADITRIPVDGKGVIDIDALGSAIKDNTVMISVMYVNNEIGTIQPVDQIAAIKEEANKKNNPSIQFHCDGVQAYCKIPIDLTRPPFTNIDMMTLSAHKIHGPQGVGALYASNPSKLKPLIIGGGQQQNLRSGTENVAAIAGFGLAADISHSSIKEDAIRIIKLREHLLKGLKNEIPDIKINSPLEVSETGEAGKCVPNILNVSFLGTRGEVILHSLEQNGIFVSTQSACSSKKKGMSPVLKAIGLSPDEAEGAIRFSLCKYNTVEEIEYTIEKTKEAVSKIRKLTRFKG